MAILEIRNEREVLYVARRAPSVCVREARALACRIMCHYVQNYISLFESAVDHTTGHKVLLLIVDDATNT